MNENITKTNPLKVQKAQELVYIFMADQTRIAGKVHRSGRLSDLLNHQANEKPFLSVTDATIVFPNGDSYSIPYITVNRVNICSCFPAEEQ